MGQQGGIADTGAQRGNIDHYFGQAVIQIFPEAACFAEGTQVLVRGTHNADIDRYFLATTDALNGSLLQEPQQLGLQRKRQIANFVQHQGAAIGDLNLAQRHFGGACESAFFKPEQLTFQ